MTVLHKSYSAPMSIAKIMKDPLIHFLLIAGAVFAAFSIHSKPKETLDTEVIQISEQTVLALKKSFKTTFGREPSQRELEAELQPHINLEVLYREGIALGLDKNDQQVRQRVAQKMIALVEGFAKPEAPTEDNLQAFLEAGDFRIPAKIDFEHLFFSPSKTRPREQLIIEASAILQQIRKGADPASFKSTTPLASNRYVSASESMVTKAFGGGRFSEALFKLPADNVWYGPFESTFGVHLAHVSKIVPANNNPPLEKIRDEVTRAFNEQQRLKANKVALRRLAERYHIEIAFPPGVSQAHP